MLAEFSIVPMGSTHISEDIALLLPILEEAHVEFRLGPTSTSLCGEWEEVIDAIRRCHEATAENGHPRIVTHIVIDDRREAPLSLEEAVAHVERHTTVR
jgi:uncharacterized protein (TIGR00106 family)